MNPGADTIVALASAHGRGERAVVRLSGPHVPAVLHAVASPAPHQRGVSACDVAISERDAHLRCRALLLRAVAPASYTGEDTAEFLLPGNPHLVERFIERCCAHEGVRRAGPGEFTARAYLHGRLSLDQAEGVAAIIAARSAADLGAARRLASGETGAAYRAWAEELTVLLALVEAGIDFTDQEDVVPIAPGALLARVEALRAVMASHARARAAEQSAGSLPLVVLVGEPNAGKSTLFNALLGRRRSVVSDEVGTTRDAIVEELHLDEAAGPGLAVRLADLPGLDAAPTGPAAQAAQGRAIEALSLADAVVHCDPRGRFDGAAWPLHEGVPVLRVRTKADLPGGGHGEVDVCALDGRRLPVLRRAIADLALGGAGSCSVTLARHARAIGRAAEILAGLTGGLVPHARALDSPELAADALRGALHQLEDVFGRVTPDDVIGRIFATFCVGK
ncbi:MAG TPA: GTPase [Phycisphaerales bacterium]|nr:GTPase [Phycisphaerales bacterium]